MKYLPIGPSSGVKGSSSPHKTRSGREGEIIVGINCTGLGPGGPVTIETKASSAPGSQVGSMIICKENGKKKEVGTCM